VAETIWATQKEMSQIFGVTPQNITIHLKNIFATGELVEKATCKESLQVQTEGSRQERFWAPDYPGSFDRSDVVGSAVRSQG